MGYELIVRAISSIIMLAIVLFVYNMGGIAFYPFLLTVAVLQYFEIFTITQSPVKAFLWGTILVSIPFGALAYIYSINSRLLVWLSISIWTSDIFCYLVGKRCGKTKINTSISPNKSWEGLLGGFIASSTVGLFFCYQSQLPLLYCLLSLMITPLSQTSDLLESLFKRIYKVKDSSNMIPGHGGIMDRVDGFILCAPALALLI